MTFFVAKSGEPFGGGYRGPKPIHEVVVTAVSAAVRAAMTMRSAISINFDFIVFMD